MTTTPTTARTVPDAGTARPPRQLTLRVGRFSARVSLTTLLVCLVQLVLALLVTLLALMHGQREYSAAEVWQTLLGQGSASMHLFIVEWRLPRAVAALLFGAMLGGAGAIFQTITRNPLGSPDIIGFTAGAYTGGIATILLVGSGYYLVSAGALLGGFATAVVVFLLATIGVARPLAQLDLGEDQDHNLGARPELTRVLAMVVGVGLVAVPTAAAGPIAFIALAAPQIGRRLAGSPGTPIVPAMCTGALLLAAADYAAQHLTLGLKPPVGLVTVCIGGLYLIWLVLRENWKGTL